MGIIMPDVGTTGQQVCQLRPAGAPPRKGLCHAGVASDGGRLCLKAGDKNTSLKIVKIGERVTTRQASTRWASRDQAPGGSSVEPVLESKASQPLSRRDDREAEGARLESVCRGDSTEGSNPSLSGNLRQTLASLAAPDGFAVTERHAKGVHRSQ